MEGIKGIKGPYASLTPEEKRRVDELARKQLPKFSRSSDGEIEALASASDGGAQGWVWRNGSWVKGPFGISCGAMILSRDEAISLIGLKAVNSLPNPELMPDIEDLLTDLEKDLKGKDRRNPFADFRSWSARD